VSFAQPQLLEPVDLRTWPAVHGVKPKALAASERPPLVRAE
jgi:hypothetical protein